MKSRRQLTEALEHKEARWQEEMATNRQLRGDLEYEKARVAAATARCQEIADQLSEVVHSKSLEIRTEALRQAGGNRYAAVHNELYLSKGVSMPRRVLADDQQVWDATARFVAQSPDDPDLAVIVNYMELIRDENADLKQKHDEERSRASEKIRLLHDQHVADTAVIEETGGSLQRVIQENQDLHREIAEKTNRLQQPTKSALTHAMAAVQGRSDRELRLISAQLRPRAPKLVLDFINEAVTSEDQELRIQAVQLAQGQVNYAREILSFLSPEASVDDDDDVEDDFLDLD